MPAPDLRGELAHETALEQALRIDAHVARIFDVVVAHGESLLGRFDAQMNVLGAHGPRPFHLHLVEDAEHEQRNEPLRRGAHVIQRASAVSHMQRIAEAGPMRIEVVEDDRAADPIQIVRNDTRKVAAIVVVRSGFGDAHQRRRKTLLHEQSAGLRHLASVQETSLHTHAGCGARLLSSLYLAAWLSVTGTPLFA